MLAEACQAVDPAVARAVLVAFPYGRRCLPTFVNVGGDSPPRGSEGVQTRPSPPEAVPKVSGSAMLAEQFDGARLGTLSPIFAHGSVGRRGRTPPGGLTTRERTASRIRGPDGGRDDPLLPVLGRTAGGGMTVSVLASSFLLAVGCCRRGWTVRERDASRTRGRRRSRTGEGGLLLHTTQVGARC
jgi:hypothetical protein